MKIWNIIIETKEKLNKKLDFNFNIWFFTGMLFTSVSILIYIIVK